MTYRVFHFICDTIIHKLLVTFKCKLLLYYVISILFYDSLEFAIIVISLILITIINIETIITIINIESIFLLLFM